MLSEAGKSVLETVYGNVLGIPASDVTVTKLVSSTASLVAAQATGFFFFSSFQHEKQHLRLSAAGENFTLVIETNMKVPLNPQTFNASHVQSYCAQYQEKVSDAIQDGSLQSDIRLHAKAEDETGGAPELEIVSISPHDIHDFSSCQVTNGANQTNSVDDGAAHRDAGLPPGFVEIIIGGVVFLALVFFFIYWCLHKSKYQNDASRQGSADALQSGGNNINNAGDNAGDYPPTESVPPPAPATSTPQQV